MQRLLAFKKQREQDRLARLDAEHKALLQRKVEERERKWQAELEEQLAWLREEEERRRQQDEQDPERQEDRARRKSLASELAVLAISPSMYVY